MTGRQLQRRPGYEIDIEKILKACAEYGVAVEINAHPWRLDLDWRWHQKALDYGCIFSINPDAHSIRELDHMHWGVEMARKGGVPPDRVLNAMPLAKLLASPAAQAADAPCGLVSESEKSRDHAKRAHRTQVLSPSLELAFKEKGDAEE